VTPHGPGGRIAGAVVSSVREAWWALLYRLAVAWHGLTGQPPPRPPFDERRAASYVGKYVLIGVTYVDISGNVLEQQQMHGRITSADAQDGLRIELKGQRLGETFSLPPDLRPFQRSRPGEYRLRATGEVVPDPDLVCRWTITRP
jgi:hypothetical protein